MNLTCKNHLPFPQAMCNKCMPPSCIAKVQPYRHVDFAEFLNVREVSNFLSYWQQTNLARMGQLYGYYAKDPNYKKGVRVIIEAIYEPKQINDINFWKFEPGYEEEERIASKIAESLQLEPVGW